MSGQLTFDLLYLNISTKVIDPERHFLQMKSIDIFSYISMEAYVVGVHWKHLADVQCTSNEYPQHMFS